MTETPRLVTTAEAARYLSVSESFLNNRRVYGGGPPFVRIGRKVAYAISDLDDFIARGRRTSTSETVAA